jgi:hypothetical protein
VEGGGEGRRGWARGVDRALAAWTERERGGWRRRRSAGEREGEGRRVRVRGAVVLYTGERGKFGPLGCVGPVVG